MNQVVIILQSYFSIFYDFFFENIKTSLFVCMTVVWKKCPTNKHKYWDKYKQIKASHHLHLKRCTSCSNISWLLTLWQTFTKTGFGYSSSLVNVPLPHWLVESWSHFPFPWSENIKHSLPCNVSPLEADQHLFNWNRNLIISISKSAHWCGKYHNKRLKRFLICYHENRHLVFWKQEKMLLEKIKLI